jgi:DNA replication protein DnaC
VTYDQLFEQVRSAPVLVLDDLGTHSATPWAEEKLFQIINDRFNTRLPTIITTNLPLSRFDDRLRARLGDPDTLQPHADPIAAVHVLEEPLPPEWTELSLLDLAEIRQMTFESFDLAEGRSPRDRERRQDAHRHALDFAASPKGWMVLVSGRERDRTHLIAAIANQRRRHGEFPWLVRVSQLLEFLRHSMFGDEHDYYKAKRNLRGWPLLLLDDLEIGMGSEYSRRELFELLYWRYLAQLPTVISTPSPLTQLLSDPGWTRLAGLMKNAASFCSDIVVGEEPAGGMEAPPSSKRPRRKAN